MNKTKNKKRLGSVFSKFGQTLRPYEALFLSADDIFYEIHKEREALKSYQEELIYKFRREFSGVGEKYLRHDLTLAMRIRLLTFSQQSEMNGLAVDIFYMNYFPVQSPEYKKAKHEIFDALDRVYAEKWEDKDAFIHSLLEALERNPQAQSMFASAASSLDLQNARAERQAALAHASISGFLDKIENNHDLTGGLKAEMNWRSELRDACQPYVEDVANDLIMACHAHAESDERDVAMKNIFNAIGDQYDVDMDLGHIFSECLVDKIYEFQWAVGTSYLTQRQNSVIADIIKQVSEWEKMNLDTFKPDIAND